MNNNHAISAERPAMPPKPNTAAAIAIKKNITAHLSIRAFSFRILWDCRCAILRTELGFTITYRICLAWIDWGCCQDNRIKISYPHFTDDFYHRDTEITKKSKIIHRKWLFYAHKQVRIWLFLKLSLCVLCGFVVNLVFVSVRCLMRLPWFYPAKVKSSF